MIACVLTLLAAAPVRAAPTSPASAGASFALIVGVNASPEAGMAALQYADDDAANYLDMFRALGARAYVLSRLDANTRGLHPQAAVEALPPRRAELHKAVEALRRDIAQAREQGVSSTLYLVYAGHGVVDDSGWQLTLEDDRLNGSQLFSQIVERAAADHTHLIVDACQAEQLALPRGPGGVTRSLRGFVESERASRSGRVGYLLSSSVSGETHEWAGFEAGVFSHEVRSGLYGAADANADGQITYTEIAAFVERANQAVINQRFRPQVLAQAPRDGELLIDLRSRRDRELRFNGRDSGSHYLLENASGVRLLDFHGSGTAQVHLVRPAGEGPLYLRRVSDGSERTVPLADGVVLLDALPVTAARAQTRGAAHQAFSQIFSLPFDQQAVDAWKQQYESNCKQLPAADDRGAVADVVGVVGLASGGALALAAGIVEVSAHVLRGSVSAHESQRDTVQRNDQIDTRNRIAAGLAIGAGVAGLVGTLLLLRPSAASNALDRGTLHVGVGTIEAGWRF